MNSSQKNRHQGLPVRKGKNQERSDFVVFYDKFSLRRMLMENSKNNWPEMQITPVGLVRSEIKSLMAGNSDLELEERMEKIREYHRKVKECVCELVISPQWVELLYGIEVFHMFW
jgi:hypothetical protein